MIQALRITLVATLTAIVVAAFVACIDRPPRTDWPPDDIGAPIGDCCNGLYLPGIFEDPQDCVDNRTNLDALQDHQCRWIDCTFATYWFCNCGGEQSDKDCR